jgi:hypothetical protein
LASWFSRRRKVKADKLRFSAVADKIGARFGTVLKEEFTGGVGFMSTPLVLFIVTLRHGSDVEVAQAQIDAAHAAGYIRPPRPLKSPCKRGNPCVFHRQSDLPQLSIVTYSAGTAIPLSGTVPTGQTGMIISLY